MDKTICIFIAATTGSGDANVSISAIKDVYGYSETFMDLGVDPSNIHIITDSDKKNLTKYKNTFDKCHIYKNIDVLTQLLNRENSSFIITLSGHGYYGSGCVYTIFNNYKITSTKLTSYIRGISRSSSAMIFGDLCHSQTMFDVHTINHPYIDYISACLDSQMSTQSCSEDYGYNGGLTSCILDYLKIYRSINIDELVSYCSKRLINAGQHVTHNKSYN